MNAFLDLTVYDKRQAKAKESKYNNQQFREPKSTDKVKSKHKGNTNRSDRLNRPSSSDKKKKEIGKSYESIVSFDGNELASTPLPRKQVSVTTERDTNKNKVTNEREINGSISNDYESIVSLDGNKLLPTPLLRKQVSGTTERYTNKNKITNEHEIKRSKSNDSESIELRKKTPETAEKPNESFQMPNDAVNGFYYTDSIELQFEEALEVCSDNLYDEIDEEFGRNLFDEESDNYILEAYNSPGNELVETYMEVEYKRVSSIFDIRNQKSKNEVEEKVSKEKEKRHLNLVSEDEECVFVEAYNSIGHEFRKTYGFVDKSLLRKSIEEDVKKNTPSITSDVQEYLREMEQSCESEDLNLAQVSNNNIYVNYSRTVNELKNNLEAMSLKNSKLDDSDSEDAISQSSDEQSFIVPVVPNTIQFIPQTKSDFIIHELLETELVYINNLKKILDDYLCYFRKFPAVLQAKVDIIFGNIEDIYKQTVEFHQGLLMCSNDYEAISLTFMDYKKLFEQYPPYMQNKPKADRILLENYKSLIEERQKKLRDRLDLMSYLLNPIQRLGRYILLMENLQKSVRRSERLDPAIDMLKYNMTKGNDAIAVESILKVPPKLDLYKKGSYVDREKFTMIKPRRQELVVFLFEEIIVFTVENVSARGDVHTTFTYSGSIDMNDLSITIVDGELQTFELKDYPKCKVNKEEGTFVFEAKDKKTRDNWGALIQGRLWSQLEKFKNQSKTYKSVSRTNSTPLAHGSKYYRQDTYMTSASASVSRENSSKSKKDPTQPNSTPDEKKQTEKSTDKVKRRRRLRDGAKRSSRFYTDPTDYKTM